MQLEHILLIGLIQESSLNNNVESLLAMKVYSFSLRLRPWAVSAC